MAETVSAAEANRQFSRILRAVEAGETFTVTSHGRPVARIAPIEAADPAKLAALDRLMDRLKSQPGADIGAWSRDDLYER
jgi:prevent-host-death family protein